MFFTLRIELEEPGPGGEYVSMLAIVFSYMDGAKLISDMFTAAEVLHMENSTELPILPV